ncbi:inositol 1,4,5-trisphosphate receptor-interacting protein-like 1 [Catharus ustulatus]|uniref:inositol 1,4,5-trisphosphate receptor-interacting protein-like 1 n=1 Tax=Catharus ustulatus TaxID=91951 RepID=UPI00140E126F|nr:inositol 1,4,5-trisphosphate receptor-interacting protein-like 1 [Catharus ustulatus]
MNSIVLLFVFLKSLILYPQLVGDSWDEETRFRMEVRAKELEWERIQQELEVEKLTPKQVQLLQLLAAAVLVFLISVLWLIGCKRSMRREGHEEEDNAANEEEVGNVAADEEDNIENELVNEAANAENNDFAWAVYEGGNDLDDNTGRIIMEHIQWPVQELQAGCEWSKNLMDNFALYFGHVLANSFYPGLQRAIGVGSAFEGWSPREQDIVYQVLIPMTPPQGHSFHLELDSAEERHVRNFRVRVQLECTCTKEQQAEGMLCFLHHPEEELRSNQDPSLLDTLCTDSYLDVQKTARWFYQLVRAIWPALPQSHNWHLKLLPSTRSCQFQVTSRRESFRIEMFFGVRRGDSDIFVSSQPREAHTQSTAWPETYAVAELKFFQYIARQAPHDTLHLRCLQFFSCLLLGIGFSTYTMKTIVMHLLNTIPVSQWSRRHFLRRLIDISESLRLSLEVKHLYHFIVGNQRLPEEISLPQDVQMAEPLNLFHRLAMDPVAHSQGMEEYLDLQRRLEAVLKPDD